MHFVFPVGEKMVFESYALWYVSGLRNWQTFENSVLCIFKKLARGSGLRLFLLLTFLALVRGCRRDNRCPCAAASHSPPRAASLSARRPAAPHSSPAAASSPHTTPLQHNTHTHTSPNPNLTLTNNPPSNTGRGL